MECDKAVLDLELSISVGLCQVIICVKALYFDIISFLILLRFSLLIKLYCNFKAYNKIQNKFIKNQLLPNYDQLDFIYIS